MNGVYAEILLATYNGEKYVGAQIDSILAQKDARWHLTLSDDGSTDGTVRILDEYASRYPDRITRYVSGKKFGNARDHFFHLMRSCEAPYMFFCDQDDVWYEEKIGKTLEAMIRAEETHGKNCPVLAFTDQTPTDENLVPLAPSLMRYQQQYAQEIDYRAIMLQNIVTGGAAGINLALAKLAAECIDEKQTIMHDWWLGIVAARFGQLVYIDEPLSDYRQHGTNSVGAKDVRSLSHIAGKLRNLDAIRKTTADKKRQAAMFVKTYERELTAQDHAFLDPFMKARSGPLFYWKNRKLIHGFFRLAGMMTLG
ncbi:MAG: glycosyltransferase family 2 protein [Clostridia bacterium]|nr:glycosyltransferase family 2 protein [Clostridia bacterium]